MAKLQFHRYCLFECSCKNVCFIYSWDFWNDQNQWPHFWLRSQICPNLQIFLIECSTTNKTLVQIFETKKPNGHFNKSVQLACSKACCPFIDAKMLFEFGCNIHLLFNKTCSHAVDFMFVYFTGCFSIAIIIYVFLSILSMLFSTSSLILGATFNTLFVCAGSDGAKNCIHRA